MDARLKALWETGLSTSKIAAALAAKISKNAVVGRAHRLKLEPRLSPIKGFQPKCKLTPVLKVQSLKETTADIMQRLNSLPDFINAWTGERKPPVSVKPRPKRVATAVILPFIGPPVAPVSKRVEPKPVVFLGSRMTCQWIEGSGRPWAMCGAASHGPWCTKHRDIVFVRRGQKKEDAA